MHRQSNHLFYLFNCNLISTVTVSHKSTTFLTKPVIIKFQLCLRDKYDAILFCDYKYLISEKPQEKINSRKISLSNKQCLVTYSLVNFKSFYVFEKIFAFLI